MHSKKILIFPGVTVPKDSKHLRSLVSMRMRKTFEKYAQDIKDGKPVNDNFGTLLYLTKFPDHNTHQFHLEVSNNIQTIVDTATSTSENNTVDQAITDDSGIFLGAYFSSVRKMEDALQKYKTANNARLFADMKDIELISPKTPIIYKSVTYKCMRVVSAKLEGKRG